MLEHPDLLCLTNNRQLAFSVKSSMFSTFKFIWPLLELTVLHTALHTSPPPPHKDT